MRQAGKPDGERMLACVAVLGVHLLFWWVLTRAGSVLVAVGEPAQALQVRWIDPPPAASRTPAAALPARRRDRKIPAQARAAAVHDLPVAAPSASLSAVYVEQGRRWAQAQGAGDDFARDPLANRHASLPGQAANRFRMRLPITPAGVVRGIGALFGGPGYATGPCPRIRENIASQQALGGDRALLGEEVRRQQAYCH